MIEIISKREIAERQQESKEEKSIRLQMLLQHMIGEAVRESSRELCEDIKQSVLKEMDYQFRQQEEREELKRQEEYREKMARIQRIRDEHYQKVDELLRSYSKKGKRKEKEKLHRFGAKKKPSIV